MRLSDQRFEVLDHITYGGEEYNLPLYIDREQGLTGESKALLHVADIIGGNMQFHEWDVHTMFEHIAKRLEDPESLGTILQDPYGKGSINIMPSITVVSIKEVGSWEIPTNLVHDMMFSWTEIAQEESQK